MTEHPTMTAFRELLTTLTPREIRVLLNETMDMPICQRLINDEVDRRMAQVLT